MHCADQAAAVAERAARLAPGGVLLIQYHSFATILERGQWNSLRHGHYAYYSAAALAAMLAPRGLTLRSAWTFELYGGTVLLAVTAGGRSRTTASPRCWPPNSAPACATRGWRVSWRPPRPRAPKACTTG